MSGLYVTLMLHKPRLETPDGNLLSGDKVFGLSISPQPYSLRRAGR